MLPVHNYVITKTLPNTSLLHCPLLPQTRSISNLSVYKNMHFWKDYVYDTTSSLHKPHKNYQPASSSKKLDDVITDPL